MDKTGIYAAEAIEYPLAAGQSTCLNFKINQTRTATDDGKRTKLSNQYILFILDVSGSMSGTAINTCIEVLSDMFKFLYNDLGNTNFDLITFNSTSQFLSLNEKPLDERLHILKKVSAGGGTCFIPVFNLITSIVSPDKPEHVKKTGSQAKTGSLNGTQPNKIQDMSIMFLSDGQAEALDNLKPHIANLNAVFRNYTRNCEFHTLGFTKSHDARVLNELTLAATTQSTFQYIESSQDIQNAMDAISGLFASRKLNGDLYISETIAPVQVGFEEITTENEGLKAWEGLVFLDMPFNKFIEAKNTMKLRLQEGSNTEDCNITFKQEKNADNKAMDFKLNLLSVHESLRKITFRLTKEKVSQEEAEKINLRINEYKKSTDDYIREIFKMRISEREPLFEMVEDLKSYLATFTELVKSNFINQLNNEQIAKLNSMAYRNVTRKGLLKKLDKRAQKAVPIINEAFEKVKKITQDVDEKALTEKYSGLIEQIGSCALTCYNFVEAMKDEDCLCITFDVARPQIAIADVTRITIKNIFPTIISARSFMDSAKFAINLNQEASGGFNEAKQGSIVKGISSENITAALPIYICEDHWKIASLLMKPILGWDITLDPVGYSYFQKKVVPFMLLTHTLKMNAQSPGSEFNKRVYDLLMETCTQIVKDDMEPEFQGTMKEDVTAIHEKYLTDGSYRTLDLVQSNYVHLCHLYVFEKMGLIPKIKKDELIQMLKYMAEEELRRKQTDWDSSQSTKYLTELLRVDLPKYLQKLREQDEKNGKKEEEEVKKEEPINDNEEKFLQKFLAELYKVSPDEALKKGYKPKGTVQVEEKKVEEKKVEEPKQSTTTTTTVPAVIVESEPLVIPRTEFLDGENMSDLKEKQKAAYDEYQAVYQTFYKDLFIWIKYFFPEDDFKLEDYSTLEKIGIDTSAKFLALYIQNKVHAKNADRKSAYTSQRYLSPWSEDTAVSFLERTYRKIIMNEKTRLEKTNRTKDVQSKALDELETFAQTDTLEVAAGVLLSGLSLGDFQQLQDIFRSQKESNVYVLEKLKMIRDKEYMGVRLNLIDVIMRKRFLRKLFKTYIKEYNYNEWKEVWFK